jgi:hypothetical protein
MQSPFTIAVDKPDWTALRGFNLFPSAPSLPEFSVVSWVLNEGEPRRADLLNRDFPGFGMATYRIYL